MFIKKIVLLLLVSGFLSNLFADENINNKASALMESQNRITHKKLIDVLFQKSELFYNDDEKIDIIKIIKVLKENGLLKIFYNEPVKLKASFNFNSNHIFTIKIISDILNKLGYQYILSKTLKRDKNGVEWVIEYESQHAIDPVSFSQELAKYNVFIIDISRKENFWKYELDAKTPIYVDAIKIDDEVEPAKYNNTRGEFWFYLENYSSSAIHIKSSHPNTWYPYIICYNNKLEILKVYKREEITKSLKLALPDGTKYIKLNDIFTPENLKHGIEIKIEGIE